MHGPHHATNMHIAIAELAQFADLIAIFAQADNRKAAFLIWRLRWAHIEKPRSIRQLHYVVDMGIDADVFVRKLRGLVSSFAGFGVRGEQGNRSGAANRQNPQAAEVHSKTFPGNRIEGYRILLDAGKCVRHIRCRQLHGIFLYDSVFDPPVWQALFAHLPTASETGSEGFLILKTKHGT